MLPAQSLCLDFLPLFVLEFFFRKRTDVCSAVASARRSSIVSRRGQSVKRLGVMCPWYVDEGRRKELEEGYGRSWKVGGVGGLLRLEAG
jgi:hypothetical protein